MVAVRTVPVAIARYLSCRGPGACCILAIILKSPVSIHMSVTIHNSMEEAWFSLLPKISYHGKHVYFFMVLFYVIFKSLYEYFSPKNVAMMYTSENLEFT